MQNTILFIFIFFIVNSNAFSQGCCSGGSGSPIAGGSSQGVLPKHQLELAGNYQFINSKKFLVGDKETSALFDKLQSNYLYLRVAYGVTKELTMSIESGYFIDKTLIGLNNKETIKSSGIGDLILFPRYDIYNNDNDSLHTEITVGIGYKIPLGKYADTTVSYTNIITGEKSYIVSPPTVQPTNGSHDFIFYAFAFRGYPKKKFRVFANALYVKKGWNALGQKFGDYASVGIFGSKTFFRKLGVTLQLKGEWIDKMQSDKNIDMLAFYNVDVKSTGGYKILFVPQVSYTKDLLTVYALSEFPIYQYVNGTQVSSQYQFTLGLSYRFCL